MSPSREYELVLMLDPEIPEERREQIASEARKRIESGGSLKHDTTWGMRKLAYEIEQRTEADYRFFRFETEGGLLDDLNHNLRIADGVLRFRVFKVDPRSPAIVPPAPMATAAATPPRGGRRPGREPAAAEAAESAQGDGAPEAPEPAAEEAPAASPAEEAEAAVEETAAEPAEETAGEPAEETAGEPVEETAGETPGEPAEETAGEEPPQAAEQDSEPQASA
ncbi:MAG: 30S ribosomal protein S6 [Actinomycetota bacterium]